MQSGAVTKPRAHPFRILLTVIIGVLSIGYPFLYWWLQTNDSEHSGAFISTPALIALVLAVISVLRIVFLFSTRRQSNKSAHLETADLESLPDKSSANEKALKQTSGDILLATAGLLFSLLLLITNSHALVKLYPALASLGIALLFASSLFSPVSLIERVASMQGATITPRAKVYTRRLTFVWTVLLCVNALIACVLAIYSPMKWWLIWTGMLSYLCFALVFIVEYAYRRHSIRRYGP